MSVGWKQTAAYSVPLLGVRGPAFLVQSYFLNFGTDVLLLAPAGLAALIALARAWDAVSDPAVGYLSDRTATRLGRRRSWMLAAGPLAALAFVAVWSPPFGLGGVALWFWCGVALLAFTTASTAWAIPHSALGAELSSAPQIRTRLFGARYVFGVTGAAASFGAMQWIVNSSEPRLAAGALASWVGFAMLLLLAVPVLALREPSAFRATRTESPLRAVRAVLENREARRLYMVWFVDQLAMASQGAIAPYMTIYVLQRPDLIGAMPAFFIGPMVLSVPLWIRLSRRVGAKRAWLVSMWGAAASYASLFFLDADRVWLAPVALAISGFCTGCGGPIGPTMLAGVMDRDARATGVRREGLFFATWAFVDKLSGAAVVLAIGFALQLSGFEPNGPLSPRSDFAIRACLALLPALAFAAGALLLRRLPEVPDARA